MKKLNTSIVNISLPKKLLEVLDGIAKVEMRGRSEMLRVMILAYVREVTNSVFDDDEKEEDVKQYTIDEFVSLLGDENKELAKSFRKLME